MTNSCPPHKVLEAARKAARKTRPQLADECGIHKHHLYMIETGRRRPSRIVARTLVETLGLRDFDHELLIAPNLRTRAAHCDTCSCRQRTTDGAAA